MPIHPDNKARLPSRDELRAMLSYDRETGVLLWRHRPDRDQSWNTKHAGKPALANLGARGYLRGKLCGRYAYQHRVIFKLMTGLEPPQIDHDDGCRSNNRWGNLYAATAVDNARNVSMKASNKSGRTGVHRGRSGKWIAQIRTRPGSHIHLGTFDDFQEACAVRERAEREVGFRVRASA
jgi:hypothetical protein